MSLVLLVHLLLMLSKDFEIEQVITGVCDCCIKKTGCLFTFSNSVVYYINGSWLFRMAKQCNDCSLALNLA